MRSSIPLMRRGARGAGPRFGVAYFESECPYIPNPNLARVSKFWSFYIMCTAPFLHIALFSWTVNSKTEWFGVAVIYN